ncbi:MAG: hypothetical protein JWP15_2244, partial [Alphaproteobacteria bacterium]|nr:hypothetical protein [Alphaproteobacteria bacterium]
MSERGDSRILKIGGAVAAVAAIALVAVGIAARRNSEHQLA